MTARTNASRPLADAAYTTLKRAIVRCELTPGQQVSEQYLTDRFELGRAATRSALGRLRHEGLVYSQPRLGHSIAPITFRRVHEVFDLRRQLEPLAARRAAESGKDLSALAELNDQCRRATYSPGDRDAVDKFLQANTKLHIAVVTAGGNSLMARVMSDLLDESERFFQLSLCVMDRNDEMYHEHHDLIDAILAGDGPRTYDVEVKQIDASEDMVNRALMGSSALREANITAAGF